MLQQVHSGSAGDHKFINVSMTYLLLLQDCFFFLTKSSYWENLTVFEIIGHMVNLSESLELS